MKTKSFMNEDHDLLHQFDQAQAKKERVALATLVRVIGSSYRTPGAKMLITENGIISGMISGGCLERDLIKKALNSIYTGKEQIVRYDSRLAFDNMEEAAIENQTLGCEGLIEIYLNPHPKEHLDMLRQVHQALKANEFLLKLPDESIFIDKMKPPIQIVIFGAGPDAVPMAQFSLLLGWHTTVLDCRSSFPTPKIKFKGVHQLISCPLEELRLHLPNTSHFVAIVMSHHFEHDKFILKLLNQIKPDYLGLLGPRPRTLRLLKELADIGTAIDPTHLFFPLGLDIGSSTPQMIALSAVAEIQAVLSKRSGGFLKHRNSAIHSSTEQALK